MTTSQTTALLLDLALILGLARMLGALARKLGQPSVIGEILAGVLLGPTLFGDHLSAVVFPSDVRPLLGALAGLGVALFMFVVGMELDLELLRGGGRVTLWVSLGSTLLPLGLGALLAWFLAPGQRGPTAGFVLFFAVAMSVTAFPVLARMIADRDLAGTTLGTTALACAAIADLLAWSLLAVVVAVATGEQFHWRLLLLVPYAALMITVVRPLLRRAGRNSAEGEPGDQGPHRNFLALVLGGLLLSAACTEWLGLHYIFGAFLFGAVMPRGTGGTLREGVLERVEPLCGLLLLPVYFVLSGLKVDLSGLDSADLGRLAAILAVAVTGKFLGGYAGARVGGLDGRRSAALGALLNTRGLTELVVLGVGLELGVLDNRMYSLMVVMAVTTTALTGPLLNRVYPDHLVAADRVTVSTPPAASIARSTDSRSTTAAP